MSGTDGCADLYGIQMSPLEAVVAIGLKRISDAVEAVCNEAWEPSLPEWYRERLADKPFSDKKWESPYSALHNAYLRQQVDMARLRNDYQNWLAGIGAFGIYSGLTVRDDFGKQGQTPRQS